MLLPIAQTYWLAIRLRCLLYRHRVLKSTWAGAPTVVIGNVIAGGAGKTPLVISLVNHSQSRGLKVGVVSRGYGRSSTNCLEVLLDTPVLESGDEAALIRRLTGARVFVAQNRVEAAQALLRIYPETQLIFCDDGLQHYALARDLEIAVFDNRGIGNGWLMPAGPLREPWPARRDQGIDLILHTGNRPAFEGFTSSRTLEEYALSRDGSRVPLSELSKRKLTAIAAIANPDVFFAMLRSRGLALERTIALPDHYSFFDYLPPVSSDDVIICTEKDAVKLFERPSMASVCILAVPLRFSPEPSFIVAFDSLVMPLISALPSANG